MAEPTEADERVRAGLRDHHERYTAALPHLLEILARAEQDVEWTEQQVRAAALLLR